MRWKINSLNDSVRRQLLAVWEEQGLGGEPCFFHRKRTLRALLVCTVIGVAATAIGLLLSVQVLGDSTPLAARAVVVGLSGLAALWTLLVMVESVRLAGSRIKPFVLITPRVIVEAGGDHDYLTGYRLRDATDFEAVDSYSGKAFRGRRFSFTFAEGSWSVTRKDAGAIRRLEEVLQRARSGTAAEGGGLHLLPEEPGLVRRTTRPFTNPFGEVWMAVAALLLMGLLVGLVASSVYARFAGRS